MVNGKSERTTTNSEALSLFLQLAAAHCGKPMAFPSTTPSFFPEAKTQEKDLRASPQRLSLSALCCGKAASTRHVEIESSLNALDQTTILSADSSQRHRLFGERCTPPSQRSRPLSSTKSALPRSTDLPGSVNSNLA